MYSRKDGTIPNSCRSQCAGQIIRIKCKKIDTIYGQVTIKNSVALPKYRVYRHKISDFLHDVQERYNDTFSNDVYEKLGMERSKNDFSKKLLYSLRDSSYLFAVEKGNMKVAQKMVGEAAREAWYTDVVYHGTDVFGFTKVDTKKSSDRISFFATDSMKVAGTYSGTSTARTIGEASKRLLNIVERAKKKAILRERAKPDVTCIKICVII